MKRIMSVFAVLAPFLLCAQPRIKEKKYPSLLWEITGKGLSKSSYLFGTMHVSSKLAFHLADSFYVGIRKADIVALETNPESWQEDMSKYDVGNEEYQYGAGNSSMMPDQYFTKSSLQFSRYIPSVEMALSSNPSSINSLLYRSYGNEASDFEEDTYLDMYIYQCGKKWGKKVAGVEQYGESMRLMSEAYRDAAKDKNRRTARYDDDNEFSGGRLQEAYRTGNLDWLDSINKYNSFSEAFDEKFMYRRNEIQAASIDSILKTGESLFVGVGAAHLPGNRGVIEILRRLGYKLRPVKMGARDSDHKTQVEKIRVPVTFYTRASADSFYKVDIPGKLYDAGQTESISQQQYADMSNGSYYMVTRVETNAWMWGQSTARVKAVIDSLLYENIPGRIIRKTVINRDGYTGIDLVNRTRRGDMQRYNIFVTPFETLIFKMSGTGEYVTMGTEADRFFNSIRLRPYQAPVSTATRAFSPAAGGFRINLPNEPFVANRGRWTFDATDRENGINYRVIRHDIHNYMFADEDSFDLSMMDESFGSSGFIDKKISSGYGIASGYPSLDAVYSDKSGGTYQVRYLIQGPHYYTILSRADKASPKQKDFINSFNIVPFRYRPAQAETDTSLRFTVQTAVPKPEGKEKIDLGGYNLYDDPETNDGSINRTRVVRSDSTGEVITVNYGRMSDYQALKDSALLEFSRKSSMVDSTRIMRSYESGSFGRNGKFFDVVVSDSGSSRALRAKVMFINGNGFVLMTALDTLTAQSTFIKTFFDTFTPADSLDHLDAYASKSKRFFTDFNSADTIVHKKAVKALGTMDFSEADLADLEKAIVSLNYNEKKYLEVKKELISKVGTIMSPASTDLLKKIYLAAADTLGLQYAALEGMVDQQTEYAIYTFRDLVSADPPVLNIAESAPAMYQTDYQVAPSGSFLLTLSDSLELTRKILPDLLPLLNLEDYEPQIRQLLARMVDSNQVKPKVYDNFYSKFLLQAKQKLKKQLIAEKQARIAKAESKKEETDPEEVDYGSYQSAYDAISQGPGGLEDYCSLLMPFYDSKAEVRTLFAQVFSTNDDDLKLALLKKMISRKKPVPDTLIAYFAGKDAYRYPLYKWLDVTGNAKLFPAKFNSQVSLATSFLYEESYQKPDSLVYLTRLPARINRVTGDVLFFKYKESKETSKWMIATVGLLAADTTVMEFEQEKLSKDGAPASWLLYGGYGRDRYQLNSLGTTRLTEDTPLAEQLRNELKRIIFSSHRSGAMFYSGQKEEERTYEEDTVIEAPAEFKN